jgi:hypothetical protein
MVQIAADAEEDNAAMTDDFEESRIVAAGPTTRVVELTTGEHVSFASEALHDMARQARENFIPMNIEHFGMLPPIGRWSDAEVKTMDDGAEQLFMYGEYLDQYQASADIADPFQADEILDDGPTSVAATLGAEARNFADEDWAQSVSDCPVPIEAHHKWAALPPIEWVLSIPVLWGATKFAGSFLERLGSEAADSLVGWLKRTSRKALESQRDRFVTLSFDLDDGGQVYGFIPFTADDDELATVAAALEAAGTLAEVAGRLNDGSHRDAHRIAYLFDGESWRLAWFVSDQGAFSTKYFAENMPDAERFLGHPLLPELPERGNESDDG